MYLLFGKWLGRPSLNPYLILSFVFAFSIGFKGKTTAQCTVNSYPYFEDFESGPGIWSNGGTNSSWTYGTPNKPVITGAASGQNCWTTGGLTGSSYNNSEHSTITSSCFDFSTLNYPFISFQIFWETEKKFDGGNLQSSIDGGVTWVNVGAFGDAVDCNTDNWFNYDPITYLGSPAWITVRHGWSGNIQANSGSCLGGGGSGTWVLAKHCLTGLANQPNVLLRFTFGSGSSCNAYDGLAIDDITISEGAVIQPDFTYTCGAGNAFSFLGNTPCTAAQSWSWDFGDPSSGSNTSTAINPSHTFSAPGTYTVTATLSGGPCNPPGTISKTVQVIGGNVINIQNPSCPGLSDGSAQANPTNGASPFSFSWSSGETNSNANQLPGGANSVTITDNNGCTLTLPVQLTDPTPISLSITPTQAGCGGLGTATVTVSGGSSPYSYVWNTTPAQNTATATNLIAGNYTIDVTDNNGCTATGNTSITSGSSLTINTSSDTILCLGSSVQLSAQVVGGTGPYSFSWSPGGETSNTITVSPVTNTTYSVSATDATGCNAGPATIQVDLAAPIQFSHTPDTSMCNGKTATLYAIDNFNQNLQFTWTPGGITGNTITVSPTIPTYYYISATNNQGCQSTDSLLLDIVPGISPAFASSNLTGCAPLCIQFTNTSSSTGTCTWDFGDGTSANSCDTITHCFSNEGYYSVTLTAMDLNGCLGINQKVNLVHVTPGPTASFVYSPDYLTNAGESIYLENRSMNATTFAWNMAPTGWNSTDENPITSFPDGNDCVYIQLVASDTGRCSDTTTIEVCLSTEFTFYIPNAFTGAIDNKNTVFKPKGTGVLEEGYEMRIFDRWGMELFRSKSLDIGWDGKIAGTDQRAPQGVYSYRIDCIDVQFRRKHHYMGKVILIQ